ncbi:MAG: hypothetical protein MZV70_28350 [Desulfobacterales bacterium]|nr:hypothetical protein [Desulfobacterales bacterium]
MTRSRELVPQHLLSFLAVPGNRKVVARHSQHGLYKFDLGGTVVSNENFRHLKTSLRCPDQTNLHQDMEYITYISVTYFARPYQVIDLCSAVNARQDIEFFLRKA